MIVRFGEFELDADAFELSRGGAPLDVQPRVLGVILHLVRERERLVTRKELLAAVWPDVHVEEDSLYRAVAIARALLREGTGAPEAIRTVRGRGYRFVGPVAEVGRSTAAEPAPPGRGDALASLQGALERARAGERQLVVVSGEAGIGKTRLVEAFAAQLRRGGGVELTRGQCLDPLGAGEPYSPLLEAVARLCRHAGSEAVAVLRTHAPSWLAQLPALREASETPALERAASGATRERLTEELADALDELAARRPLVLVLEDLHWCDRATLGLLAALARRREPARLLAVATARSGEPAATDAPLWRLVAELKAQGRCQEIALTPLSERELGELLALRLPSASAQPEIRSWLSERSAGNPLFAHHLIDLLCERKLLRSGVGARELDALGVPSTPAELIERQIEALAPASVRLLEAASAAGPEWTAAEVAAALEADPTGVEDECDELARRALFLARAGVTEWEDGALSARFRFRHALHRDALYARVAPLRRRELHLRIGRRLEAGLGARAHEIAAPLASHFAAGGDAVSAARYYRTAIELASGRRAGHEARLLAERAFEILPLLGDAERDAQELAIRFALAPALPDAVGFADPSVGENLARAEALCERLGDAERRPALLWSRCWAHYQAGEPGAALAAAERLLAAARALARPGFEVLAHDALALSYHKLCRFAESQAEAEQALALHDPERDATLTAWIGQDVGVDAAITSAFNLWYLGRPGEARRRMEQAILRARGCGHGYSLVLALSYAAAFHVAAEDGELARSAAQEAIARARDEKLPGHRAFAELMRAAALPPEQGRLGAMVAALPSLALAAGGEAPRLSGTAAVRALFASALAEAGQRALASAQLAEAFADAERSGELHQLPGLHLLRAALASDDAEREREILRALETASQVGNRMTEVEAAAELCRLHASIGRKSDARERLAGLLAEMREEPDVAILRRARSVLGSAPPT